MLNFVLCDDNKMILNRLEKILESIFINNNIDAKVSYTSDNTDDLLNYIKSNHVDVLFLDIDLKDKLNGIDIGSYIRKFDKNMYIIFMSAHLEYILLAYRCKTFDFIPKPITLERVKETILRLMDDLNDNNVESSFIRLNTKNTIINKDNINFIKKDGMKVVFYTDSRAYETYSSFNKISNELPDNFVRCHKSFIANVDKICSVNSSDNSISFNNSNDGKCFIGPKYKNKFMEVLNNGNFSNNLDSINNRK